MSIIIPLCHSWFFTASLSLSFFLVWVVPTAACVPISSLLFFFDNKTSKLGWTHGHQRLISQFPLQQLCFYDYILIYKRKQENHGASFVSSPKQKALRALRRHLFCHCVYYRMETASWTIIVETINDRATGEKEPGLLTLLNTISMLAGLAT